MAAQAAGALPGNRMAKRSHRGAVSTKALRTRQRADVGRAEMLRPGGERADDPAQAVAALFMAHRLRCDRSIIIAMMEVPMAKSGQPDQDWRAQVLNMAEQATSLTPAPLASSIAPAPFSVGPHLQPQFDPIELGTAGAEGLQNRIRKKGLAPLNGDLRRVTGCAW
jgi:hypothetical protein